MRFFSLLLVFLLGGTAHAGGVDRLKAFIAGAKTAEADFSQTVTDRNGRITQRASGKMAFARPGKFRWDYTTPYSQVTWSSPWARSSPARRQPCWQATTPLKNIST